MGAYQSGQKECQISKEEGWNIKAGGKVLVERDSGEGKEVGLKGDYGIWGLETSKRKRGKEPGGWEVSVEMVGELLAQWSGMGEKDITWYWRISSSTLCFAQDTSICRSLSKCRLLPFWSGDYSNSSNWGRCASEEPEWNLKSLEEWQNLNVVSMRSKTGMLNYKKFWNSDNQSCLALHFSSIPFSPLCPFNVAWIFHFL